MGAPVSQDDMLSCFSAGRYKRVDWNKNFPPTTAGVAGEWQSLFRGAGNPGADSILNTGTNLAFQALSDTTTNATGILHGGNVGGNSPYKVITNISAYTNASTTVPCTMMLVDMLGFYRVTSVTTTGDQTCDNSVTLPRFTDGGGVFAYAVNTNATAMGNASPNLQLTYTRATTGGTDTGRITPAVLPACKAQAANGVILHSGNGAGKYAPFIPLQSPDQGIKSIQKINLSVSYVSGEFAVVLCRPLVHLFITTLGVPGERECISQIPSSPRIYDGACLNWLMYSGANTPTNSPFYGHFDCVWTVT